MTDCDAIFAEALELSFPTKLGSITNGRHRDDTDGRMPKERERCRVGSGSSGTGRDSVNLDIHSVTFLSIDVLPFCVHLFGATTERFPSVSSTLGQGPCPCWARGQRLRFRRLQTEWRWTRCAGVFGQNRSLAPNRRDEGRGTVFGRSVWYVVLIILSLLTAKGFPVIPAVCFVCQTVVDVEYSRWRVRA